MDDKLSLSTVVNLEKIIRIREAQGEGSYHVSALQLADSLIRHQVQSQFVEGAPTLRGQRSRVG